VDHNAYNSKKRVQKSTLKKAKKEGRLHRLRGGMCGGEGGGRRDRGQT